MKAAVASVVLLVACSNLMKAHPPTHRFDNAHLYGATALAFGPDVKILASGGLKGEIALWRVGESPIARFNAHHGGVYGRCTF